MLTRLFETIDRAALLNTTVSRRGYSVERDLSFSQHPRLKFDAYHPDKPKAEAPLVVYIHGGSWQLSSKDDYLFIGEAFANSGYTVLIPNYRIYPEVTFPTFVYDAATFLKWLECQPQYCDRSLVLVGHSAGALNAYLATLDPRYFREVAHDRKDLIKGLIGLAGPYDFLPLVEEEHKVIFPEDIRPMSQAVDYVAGDHPPSLLLVGAKDITIDPKNSHSLHKALSLAGNQSDLKVYDNLGHLGIISAFARIFRWRAPVLNDCLAFIEKLNKEGSKFQTLVS